MLRYVQYVCRFSYAYLADDGPEVVQMMKIQPLNAGHDT